MFDLCEGGGVPEADTLIALGNQRVSIGAKADPIKQPVIDRKGCQLLGRHGRKVPDSDGAGAITQG